MARLSYNSNVPHQFASRIKFAVWCSVECRWFLLMGITANCTTYSSTVSLSLGRLRGYVTTANGIKKCILKGETVFPKGTGITGSTDLTI